MFYILSIFIIMLDQITKIWVRSNMELGEVKFWGNDYIHFNYYENSGAAFSSFQGYGRLFAILAILVVIVIVYYRKKGELQGFIMNVGTGLLSGGAIGNAIDRVWRGKVTDFIVLGSNTGIMNLADIAINFGVILIIIGMVFTRTRRKKRTSMV
ncbi:signal peptidase II [Paenibacillus sp. IHBB 10380]|uniref:signal peptidase II n=1 Tax=Paenibacillus sp. IHBB 10380 TaxID=1566358 RepID=UPI0005CF9BC2|nr:signal peptidase II [Paenibacillus sp. IHBB 10380]AJS58797.1 signal peptidase II [Paenibacillus sp. IHBB 10380]